MDVVDRIEELRRALKLADAGSFLVEHRVIRRMIREIFGYARLSGVLPHTECLIVNADRLHELVHPDELGLPSFADVPSLSVLIALPDEDELQSRSTQELMQTVWRRLFHSTIDRTLRAAASTELTRSVVQQRIDQIGQVEFDEAHFALKSEHRLFDPESRIAAYCEFVATWFELQKFAPDLLPVWFPSLAGHDHVSRILSQDIDAESLFQKTRLYAAPIPDVTPGIVRDEEQLTTTRLSWNLGTGVIQSDRNWTRNLRRRERALEKGNTVGAMVWALRAAAAAPSEEKRRQAREHAESDVRMLADRLRMALNFPESELSQWTSCLAELAANSLHEFWNADRRLLYDLQKVCLAHERVTYKVDLVKWIVSRGKRPLRRPLNSLREVMMAKYLASSAARVASVTLSGIERERLDGLLHEAAQLAEHQMRERMRSTLAQTLMEVGLRPENLPEKVAFDKLIEDSLDCIVERGYLTMGYLRDAISRNDLKLPDLKHPRELFLGDHLLRADDRLDVALDGVYQRGEFYLRWLQVVSSLFFGTRPGRFATLFLIIPFGGAVIVIAGAQHLIHLASSLGTKADAVVSKSESDTISSRADNAAEEHGRTDATELPAQSAERSDSSEPQTTARTTEQITGENNGQTSGQTTEQTIESSPAAKADAHHAFDLAESLPLVLTLGFILMGLIHLPAMRHMLGRFLKTAWKYLRTVLVDIPLKICRMPLLQRVWKSRLFVRLRRVIITPFLLAWIGCVGVPWIFRFEPLPSWWVLAIGVLSSFALNSRFGRDAEELTVEWLANLWHNLTARVVMAVIDSIIDFFKTVLGFIERFLYAVDEWLRFHSGESWLTVIVKAVLGVVWSFAAFLIRVYVNLLIEPTLHPVKHFPVVTVAHKMMLPIIKPLGEWMVTMMTPYLGIWLAGMVTAVNIFFLPGIFGFLVWELKENWRLYASNRRTVLRAVIVGSHGETVPRLMRPGFHSGTMPKLYRRLRKLELVAPSLNRYRARRAQRSRLEHVQRDVRRFVERELIHLLELIPCWKSAGLRCGRVHIASNSIHIDVHCEQITEQPLTILLQEQSGWIVASIAHPGWRHFASSEQLLSFAHALSGFYRKSGIDLVREQLARHVVHNHPYDITSEGLAVWPGGLFHREILIDLHRRFHIRPMPASEAATYSIVPVERSLVVFSDTRTEWVDWVALWMPREPAAGDLSAPAACTVRPRISVIG